MMAINLLKSKVLSLFNLMICLNWRSMHNYLFTFINNIMQDGPVHVTFALNN